MKGTLRGFGVKVPMKEAGWFEKEIPTPKMFEALAEPVMLAPCTSDVHQVLEAAMPVGLILGHEVVARIVEVGPGVTRVKPGDVVAVGAVTPDWRTPELQDNIHQHGGGSNAAMNWCVTQDGTFADYFLIRDVDLNVAFIPEGVTMEQALMTGDMVTTGFHGAELANVKFGDTVVVCGIGPVGQMAVAGSALRGAGRIIAIGNRPNTFKFAKEFGATDCIDYKAGPIDEQVLEVTDGVAPDCCIVAGGHSDSLAKCIKMVKSNGIVTNLVGQFHDLHVPALDSYMWCTHKTLNGGLCPGGRRRLERLFSVIAAGRVDPSKLITQRFHGLEKIEDAYNLMVKKTNDVIKPIVYTDK